MGSRNDEPDGAPAGLIGNVRLACDLFDRSTVDAMVARLAQMLAIVGDDPECRIATIDLLSEAQRQRILG